MKKIVIGLVILTLGIFLAAGTTTAATTGIVPGPENPLILSGGILDTLYGLGNLQRVDDDGDRTWFPANGNATATAKYAGLTHEFGYIPDLNRNGFGDDSFQSLFTVAGGIYSDSLSGPSASLTSGNFLFLWALQPSKGPQWTSLPSQNDDGLDHMVTWRVLDTPNTWVIAWEDLPADSDKFDADYNDLVVEVQVSPVPIPGAILLLGSGLVGLAGIRKKFKS